MDQPTSAMDCHEGTLPGDLKSRSQVLSHISADTDAHVLQGHGVMFAQTLHPSSHTLTSSGVMYNT